MNGIGDLILAHILGHRYFELRYCNEDRRHTKYISTYQVDQSSGFSRTTRVSNETDDPKIENNTTHGFPVVCRRWNKVIHRHVESGLYIDYELSGDHETKCEEFWSWIATITYRQFIKVFVSTYAIRFFVFSLLKFNRSKHHVLSMVRSLELDMPYCGSLCRYISQIFQLLPSLIELNTPWIDHGLLTANLHSNALMPEHMIEIEVAIIDSLRQFPRKKFYWNGQRIRVKHKRIFCSQSTCKGLYQIRIGCGVCRDDKTGKLLLYCAECRKRTKPQDSDWMIACPSCSQLLCDPPLSMTMDHNQHSDLLSQIGIIALSLSQSRRLCYRRCFHHIQSYQNSLKNAKRVNASRVPPLISIDNLLSVATTLHRLL